MLDIDTTGLDQALAQLRRLRADQIPFATALGLTRLAQAVKAAEIAEMQRVFDRPTPFTLNSLFVQPARKTRLVARVWLREWAPKGTPATKYLAPQIAGGARAEKRTEMALRHRGILGADQFLVPGRGAPLDRYGNVSRGRIVQMLSALGAASDRYQNSREARRRGRYFPLYRGPRLLGIFERTGTGIRSFLIATRAPRYRVRFKFYDVAAATVAREGVRIFREAMAETRRTAR